MINVYQAVVFDPSDEINIGITMIVREGEEDTPKVLLSNYPYEGKAQALLLEVLKFLRAIDNREVSEFLIFFRQGSIGLPLEGFKDCLKLDKSSCVDGFKEAALFNASFWGNEVSREFILFEFLQEVPSREMFLQMKVD